MFLVRQQVYLCVGYVLLLWVEVTLHFLEMLTQHLQLGLPQGIELPWFDLVVSIIIEFVDLGGSGNCFSLALTNVLLGCLFYWDSSTGWVLFLFLGLWVWWFSLEMRYPSLECKWLLGMCRVFVYHSFLLWGVCLEIACGFATSSTRVVKAKSLFWTPLFKILCMGL